MLMLMACRIMTMWNEHPHPKFTLRVNITKISALANGERKGLCAPLNTPAGIGDCLPDMKSRDEDVGGLAEMWLDVERRCFRTDCFRGENFQRWETVGAPGYRDTPRDRISR
jgi:hypothetical protein